MAWPTTDNPRTEFVTVRLTADEAADLDWLKDSTGAGSRSEAARDALESAITRERKRAQKAQKASQP